MPQDYPTDDVFETLYQEIEKLKKRIADLERNAVPTIPVYDYLNQPQDPVEGQLAILLNAPES